MNMEFTGMSNDYIAGRDEIIREIKRAKMNLEGLLLRKDIPDRGKLESAIMCMSMILDYLEPDDE